MREPGKWEFPGGKVEEDESPSDALRREIFEELEVRIAVGDRLGRGSAGEVVLDVYIAEIVAGEPRAAEHAELAWIGAGEIAGLDWAAADVPILGALRRKLG